MSILRPLVRQLLSWVLGKASDSITGGDPLDPGNTAWEPDDEDQEPDPVYPNETVEAQIPREKMREVVADLHARLERGFRDTQQEVLAARAHRLKPGDRFVLLCNVYHGGFPTGLQITGMRVDAGSLLLHLEGRGPAMSAARAVLEPFELSPRQERDGSFREHGLGWRARLPAEWGTFLGHPVDIDVERGWPGMVEIETPAESLFLQGLVKALKSILAPADLAFRNYVGEEVVGDVGRPRLCFHADAPNYAEWMLVVSRSNWKGFRWRIDFVGIEVVGISAGS